MKVRAFAVAVGCLLVLACGGGGGGGVGGGGGGGISDAQRAIAIEAVNDRFEQILAGGGTRDSQVLAIATFMDGRPEFESAGANSDDLCAWGRFADGRLLIVGNNRYPDTTPPPDFRWTPRPKATFVTTPSKARLMHAFGPNFSQLQQPIDDMKRYLQKDNLFTITGTPEGKARLSDLRVIAGDGFFYINAHGGKGTTKSGDEVFVMASSTPYDAGTEALPDIKADWDADLLTYYTGETGDTVGGVRQVATTYAVNHKFVTRYMSFGKNAVVFLNVCFTANSHLEVGRFRAAIRSKGAGVVMGWTQLCNSASAFNAARYFVDRLVASNDFQKENPDQRSFAVNEILAAMSRKGLDKDGNSSLIASYGTGTTNVLLRPTIKYMFRDEINDYLVLDGEFGMEPGIVTVNDVPATVVGGWASQRLLTRIPSSGAGCEGPVVVEVHGKKSKPRYLTGWRGTYTFSFIDTASGSTLKETATVQIHLRCDVDQYRERPGDPLADQLPRSLSAARDSTLTWSCSGTIVDGQGVQMRWTGGGTPPLQYATPITAPTNAWQANGGYLPATRRVALTLTNGGPKTEYVRGQGTRQILPLSSDGFDKGLNADWTIPATDYSSGDTVRKFSTFAVFFPPPNEAYRP